MVASVLTCEQFKKMNDTYFAGFIHKNFKSMSQKSINSHSFLFVQDGDPSQNSKIAKIEVGKHGGKQISITA